MIAGFPPTATNHPKTTTMTKNQAKKKIVTKVTSKNKTKDKTRTISKRMRKAKKMAEKKEEVKGTNKIKNKAVDKEKTESRMMIATDNVQMKSKGMGKVIVKDKIRVESRQMAMGETMNKLVEMREVKARAVDKYKTATILTSSGPTMPNCGMRTCWHRRRPTS